MAKLTKVEVGHWFAFSFGRGKVALNVEDWDWVATWLANVHHKVGYVIDRDFFFFWLNKGLLFFRLLAEPYFFFFWQYMLLHSKDLLADPHLLSLLHPVKWADHVLLDLLYRLRWLKYRYLKILICLFMHQFFLVLRHRCFLLLGCS